jgi:monoamine oxidase
VPVGVLQAAASQPGAIAFDPVLTEKRSALQGIVSGGVIKVVCKFRSAFWESMDNGRLRDVSFFHAASAEFPTYWSLLPMRSAHLVAWAGGPRVISMAQDSDESIIRRALKSAQSVFQRAGDLSTQLERADTHHWQRDPFARGAYSYQIACAPDARKELAEPVRGTLYFAGEATNSGGQAATVAGALESGRAAASLILRAAGAEMKTKP